MESTAVAKDATPRFLEILANEPARLDANRADFLSMFRDEDFQYLADRWSMKVGFCNAGDMKWGIYSARKPG